MDVTQNIACTTTPGSAGRARRPHRHDTADTTASTSPAFADEHGAVATLRASVLAAAACSGGGASRRPKHPHESEPPASTARNTTQRTERRVEHPGPGDRPRGPLPPRSARRRQGGYFGTDVARAASGPRIRHEPHLNRGRAEARGPEAEKVGPAWRRWSSTAWPLPPATSSTRRGGVVRLSEGLTSVIVEAVYLAGGRVDGRPGGAADEGERRGT